MKEKQVVNKQDLFNHDDVFISTVLDHYKKLGRHSLIWRQKITPYRVLVSEIMLQQTQVTRVIPKFEEWMKRFPTLLKLSESSLTEVLMLWQGLGYQRRAKSLLAISKLGSDMPVEFSELLLLPGVGKYTASALSAFAYDRFSHPLLETNIRTALIEQYHSNKTDIHDGVLYDDLSRLEKNKVVQSVGARTWYYALMDYGAYLKLNKISHNAKSRHSTTQTKYKGSRRELRAKVLFSIAGNEKLPEDVRLESVLYELLKEGFLKKEKNDTYRLI
jgi:A/G-specific adenine glycosylase